MFRDLLVPSHIIVIALVVFLVFGWKKMPDMARSLGRSARILKSEVDEYKTESAERNGTTPVASEISEQVVEETHIPTHSTMPTSINSDTNTSISKP